MTVVDETSRERKCITDVSIWIVGMPCTRINSTLSNLPIDDNTSFSFLSPFFSFQIIITIHDIMKTLLGTYV